MAPTTPTNSDENVTEATGSGVTAAADGATAEAPARKVAKRASRKATAPKAAPAVTADADAATEAAGSTGTTDPAQSPEPAPAKKAARRSPRKKAAEPAAVDAPTADTHESGEPAAATDDPAAASAEETTPAPAKRARRATRSRAAAAPTQDAPDQAAATEGDNETEDEADGDNLVVPNLGLLFQAPDLTQAQPRRRRASRAEAGAPTTSADEPTSAEAPAHAEAAGGDATGAAAEASESTERTGRATRTRRTRRGEHADQGETTDHSDRGDTTAPADHGDSAAVTDEARDGEQANSEDGSDDDAIRRRRRRGGRGRRAKTDADSGSSAQQGESATADQGDSGDTAAADGDADHDDSDESGSSATSRRRTRRRRRSGGGGGEDDAPGVTTRVRERRDEVTAVRGSTRLEAKKQRRREGREAGRRRTIISEAEFLARRESVERVMVVRTHEERTQIGVLEDGVLVEHYVDRETSTSMVGNIYLGRVQNVLPSMEAAFVDIGRGRNAVLYAGEVNWDAAGLEGNSAKRIENALESGQAVLVQVTKDPIGHKGARLTSQISLPGRYLVYVPDSSMTGISRKLPDTERTRLKRILRDVLPASAGVIVRTAAEGASEDELRADVERLTGEWARISADAEAAGAGTGKSGSAKKGKRATKGAKAAPVLLHGEPDMTVKVIRDIFNEDFSKLVVAGDRAWAEVSNYLASVAPDLAERASRWTEETDVFAAHRIDEQIAKAMDRKVWLPSGGSLVIDRTEAMTVIDVNTGKFIGTGGNLEETVTKNNLEAAEEIVRQLRLRDVGGIIVIDFIDMVLESNRDLVVRRLLECLGRDRTKHQVAEVTSLGLVQMTRKRVGSGLIEVFSETCEHCNGRGILIHAEPVDKSGGGEPSTGDRAGSRPAPQRQSRSRRGSSSASTQQPAPAPGGPTPAQIAAAAHAAALKGVAAAGGEESTDREIGQVAFEQVDLIESPAEGGALDEGATLLVPDTAVMPVELDESLPAAQLHEQQIDRVLHLDRPTAEHIEHIEPADHVEHVEPADSADSADPAEAAASTGRGRRRRGRVTAPAGPPTGE